MGSFERIHHRTFHLQEIERDAGIRQLMILGVSPGATASATAQQHLGNILAYLDMRTLGQPEAFIQWRKNLIDQTGAVGPGSRAFLQDWMNRFVA